MLKIWRRSWEPFRSCLLNSTANPAHFQRNWAGLAVLFSRELLNGSQDFFSLLYYNFYLIKKKYPPKRFCLHIFKTYFWRNSGIGSVKGYCLLFFEVPASRSTKICGFLEYFLDLSTQAGKTELVQQSKIQCYVVSTDFTMELYSFWSRSLLFVSVCLQYQKKCFKLNLMCILDLLLK